MTCMRRVRNRCLAGKAPRIRSRHLAANRALPAKQTCTTERRLRNRFLAGKAPRIRSRPLPAKPTCTTERRLRNRFLAGKAPRIRSRPLAAKRADPRVRSRPRSRRSDRPRAQRRGFTCRRRRGGRAPWYPVCRRDSQSGRPVCPASHHRAVGTSGSIAGIGPIGRGRYPGPNLKLSPRESG